MEKARDKFEIGQSVEIIVHNSHYGDIGKVVAFDKHNEYNVKVAFGENYVQGYMVNELKPIPKLGQRLSAPRKFLQILSRVARIGKNWKLFFYSHKTFILWILEKQLSL